MNLAMTLSFKQFPVKNDQIFQNLILHAKKLITNSIALFKCFTHVLCIRMYYLSRYILLTFTIYIMIQNIAFNITYLHSNRYICSMYAVFQNFICNRKNDSNLQIQFHWQIKKIPTTQKYFFHDFIDQASLVILHVTYFLKLVT